ncbi:MAG: FemAB family PEP-CTERM system-associated protein [Desulfobacteraceae bacterium]|nr:FemAB family PEP-CTERM system-associated protein [Desulfobacteraceae bacterium]
MQPEKPDKNLDFRIAGTGDKKKWDAYVAAHPNGLAYHFFGWKQAVETAYGFSCPYFLAENNGRIFGILPAVHVHLPLDGGALVSLPYCDLGGILADRPDIRECLFRYACRYAQKAGIHEIELRMCADENISQAGKVRMLLELPGSSEALLQTLKSKVRSQVKKPLRDGLTVRLGGFELLADFYPVFARNMKALGSPVHSRNWMAGVLRHYGDKAKCGMVYMPDKTPAAGGIILCHSRTVSIPWASSLPHLNRFNPNMLLYWSFLKFAADQGYSYFDFGRSTPGEGTYRFKAQWGAEPRPLYWEKWKLDKNGAGPIPAERPANSNTKGRGRAAAENFIRHMPLPAATFLGSRIRKYISL